MRKKLVEKLVKETMEAQRKEGLAALAVVAGVSAVGHVIQTRRIKKLKQDVLDTILEEEDSEEE